MRTISPFEFARLISEERATPAYQGNDYLNIHEDRHSTIEHEFMTEVEYPDDWYCQVIYDITFDYIRREESNHEVTITSVKVKGEDVQLTEEQEEELTKALTERANVEYEFYDTEGLYPDYATSYTW